jgi:hypothetical protein
MSSLETHNAFAENVLDRLVSGLRAKISSHVANNYYSHELLCKEAWRDAKQLSTLKHSKGDSNVASSDNISADDVSKYLLPVLAKKFPQTIGNSTQTQQFLLTLLSSTGQGVSQFACCKAIQCLHATKCKVEQQKKGYEPNLSVFSSRLSSHPERLKNMYFTWLFLLRALKKAQHVLKTYDFSSGTPEQTKGTIDLMRQLLKHVDKSDEAAVAFSMRAEDKLFQTNDEKARLISVVRDNFHTISQNIDCIACDSCKLQAKIKITGLAFAVRIILDDDSLKNNYGRNDVIAFINTIQQFSKGLRIVHRLTDLSNGKPDPWIHSECTATSADACSVMQ